MIKFTEARLTDSLPRIITKEPWAQALSAAVKKQVGEITETAQKAMIYAEIQRASEEILDILAAEMQIPEYLPEYSVQIKRALVLGGLSYWSKAGTVQATEDVLKSIFEDADISEWFEYSGDPGYFKITTTNPNITEQNVADFKAAAERVKRLSAWLDGVELVLGVESMNIYVGFVLGSAERVDITQKS